MVTEKTDPPVLERHRRMADAFYLEPAGTTFRPKALAQLIATVERDARAEGEAEAFERGVVNATRWLYAGGYVLDQAANACRSALLPEPPRGEGES